MAAAQAKPSSWLPFIPWHVVQPVPCLCQPPEVGGVLHTCPNVQAATLMLCSGPYAHQFVTGMHRWPPPICTACGTNLSLGCTGGPHPSALHVEPICHWAAQAGSTHVHRMWNQFVTGLHRRPPPTCTPCGTICWRGLPRSSCHPDSAYVLSGGPQCAVPS